MKRWMSIRYPLSIALSLIVVLTVTMPGNTQDSPGIGSVPFGGQSQGDPFGNQGYTDPYDYQGPGNQYGNPSYTNPYGQQNPSDPFGSQGSTGPYNNQNQTGPHAGQGYPSQHGGPGQIDLLRQYTPLGPSFGYSGPSRDGVAPNGTWQSWSDHQPWGSNQAWKQNIAAKAYEDADRQAGRPNADFSSRYQYIDEPEQLQVYDQAFHEAQDARNQAFKDVMVQPGGTSASSPSRYVDKPALQRVYEQYYREALEARSQAFQDATARTMGIGVFSSKTYTNNPEQQRVYDQSYREAQQIRRQAHQDAVQKTFTIGFVPDSRSRYVHDPEKQRIYDEAFRSATQNASEIMSQAFHDAYQQSLGPPGASYFGFGRGAYSNAEQQIYDEAFRIAQQNIWLENWDWPETRIASEGIADLLADPSEAKRSIAVLEQILATKEKEGSYADRGSILNNIGYVYHANGRLRDALHYYQKALPWTSEGSEAQATVLGNFGLVYLALAQEYADEKYSSGRALEYQMQALDIWQQQKDHAREDKEKLRASQKGEAATLNNIGLTYRAQKDYDKAVESYQKALDVWCALKDERWQVTVLNNIGRLYEAQCSYEEALESYGKALDIAQGMDSSATREPLHDDDWSEFEAQRHYEQALGHLQVLLDAQTEDPLGQSITLRSIGLLYQVLGRDAEAVKRLQRALRIQRREKDRFEQKRTLTDLGLVYQAQGDSHRARKAYEDAQDIVASDTAVQDVAQTGEDLIRNVQALDAYAQPQAIQPEEGKPVGLAVLLYNIGRVYQAQGSHSDALNSYGQAMDYLDVSRAAVWSEQGRVAFIAQHASLYGRAAGLLHQVGQDAEAFYASERGRARAFLDSLATGKIELSDELAVALLTREQEAYAELQATRKAYDDALSSYMKEDAARTVLAMAEATYDVALMAIERRNDRLGTLVPGRQVVLGVSEVQALLDEETTLLSFFVLDEQTLAFLITSQSFEMIAIQASRHELNEKIQHLLRSIRNPEIARQWSQKLNQMLMTPVSEYIHTPHLVIVPHGPLHYLPFAALESPDTDQYLIQQYSLAVLPSASALPLIQGNVGGVSASPLILGNPDGSVWFAGEAARAIAKIFGVRPLLNGDATESVVRTRAGKTNILHLAAHGDYNADEPLQSAVLLGPDDPSWFDSILSMLSETLVDSHDGRLEVSEVYVLNLRNTDLVTLSACRTQLGQQSAGDEVVGLTRAFFFAGTPTVVATLWEVEDKTTGQLMERFYTYLDEGLGKADALRQAQLDVLKDYPAPYHWAGFVLSGDGGTLQVPERSRSWPILIGGFLTISLVGVIAASLIAEFSLRRQTVRAFRERECTGQRGQNPLDRSHRL